MSPSVLIVLVVYLGCAIWSLRISMTSSRLIPNDNYVGLRQYELLFDNARWQASVINIGIFGALFVIASLVLGVLLAILIDQRVRGENVFRSLFLYPYSMSFVVTGLVWNWLLNPTYGIEKMGRDLGFSTFKFDWIVSQSMVVYTLVFAAVWHAAGLVMAIALAGLRGIDPDIWKASRVDGIPASRTYLQIVLPMMGGALATATILLTLSVVRLYDLVVVMTKGGPGLASEVPAKFVVDHLFDRGNIGLATAASTVMLITVLAVIAPWVFVQRMRARKVGAA